mmetsp:Transcript_23800/g.40529  ORF Transcript_23800/g.40529 Transcript_23800/m.40529 type:complete len:91 (+) Transcript_23800:59-331(+)
MLLKPNDSCVQINCKETIERNGETGENEVIQRYDLQFNGVSPSADKAEEHSAAIETYKLYYDDDSKDAYFIKNVVLAYISWYEKEKKQVC